MSDPTTCQDSWCDCRKPADMRTATEREADDNAALGRREIAGATTDDRDPQCVAAWPDCWDGGYHPSCCRFPKSCSCTLVRGLAEGGGQ